MLTPVPYTQEGLPFARRSHTSYKAAVSVIATRETKTRAYLRLLYRRGALTDHEAHAALDLPLQSICSIRNGVMTSGLVRKGIEERVSPYGKDCATWMLTDAGRVFVSICQPVLDAVRQNA